MDDAAQNVKLTGDEAVRAARGEPSGAAPVGGFARMRRVYARPALGRLLASHPLAAAVSMFALGILVGRALRSRLSGSMTPCAPSAST